MIANYADANFSTGDATDADRSLVVRFSIEAKIDGAAVAAAEIKAAEEARAAGTVPDPVPPKYKDVEYIKILIPGDKTLNVHRPVMPSDKARFPAQYAAFKSARGMIVHGTSLAGWPLVTESQRKELEFFNIYTVEQLSEVNDGFASSMMGVQQLKQAAQRYLSAAKEKAPAVKFAQELEQRDHKIAVLEDRLNKVLEQLDKAHAPTKGSK